MRAPTRPFHMPDLRELLDQGLEITRQLMLPDQHGVPAAGHGDLVLERVGFRSRHGASGGEQPGDCVLYAGCGLTTKFGRVEISAKCNPR
jgi:hypothetical protein